MIKKTPKNIEKIIKKQNLPFAQADIREGIKNFTVIKKNVELNAKRIENDIKK